jgi:hypothetical protein
VCGEVLEGREHLAGAERQAAPLVAAHGGDPELADQEGILAVGLLDAAPARVTRQIDHGGQHDLATAGSRLLGGDGHRPLDERRVPGRAERERHREVRRLRRHEAVQGLLVEHHGDAEARVLDHPLLDRVGELGVLARAAHVRAGGGPANLAGARQLAEAMTEQCGRAARDEGALGVLQRLERRPARDELRDLLLDRHAPEQIDDALGDRAGGVLVQRRRWLPGEHRHGRHGERQGRGEARDRGGRTESGHGDPSSLAVRNTSRPATNKRQPTTAGR